MKTNLQADDLTKDILFMLIDHFNYSIRDVNSYEELTEDEKLISQVKGICHTIEEEIVREAIVEKSMRPDGRALDEIRPISTMINLIPRVHGSALFTRGQTQCLSIVTLGNTMFSSVACSALLLLPFLLASRWTPETMADTPFFVPEVDVRTHGFIFLKSVIVLASWAFGFFSMKNLPITLVSPINATRPMWTLVGALLIFHEQLSLYQWIGILLALLSFMAFSFVGRKEGVSFVHNKWIYCLIIAVVLGAASGLYDKYLMHRFDRMAVQVYYMIYQALLMVVFLFLWMIIFLKKKYK